MWRIFFMVGLLAFQAAIFSQQVTFARGPLAEPDPPPPTASERALAERQRAEKERELEGKKVCELVAKLTDKARLQALSKKYGEDGRVGQCIEDRIAALDASAKPELPPAKHLRTGVKQAAALKEKRSALLDKLLARAIQHGFAGRVALARSTAAAALKIDPKAAKAYNAIGLAYMNSNQCSKAIESLRLAVELRPDYTQAIFNQGWCFERLGKSLEAFNAYSKAIELRPSSTVWSRENRAGLARQLQKFDVAISDYSFLIAREGKGRDAQIGLCRTYADAKNFALSLQACNEAIAHNPAAAAPLTARGQVHLESGDLGSAMRDFEAALAIEPIDFEALIGRAWVHHRHQSFKDAVADLTSALSVDPNSALAFERLAMAHRRLEQWDDATAVSSKWVASSATSARAYMSLGISLAGKGDREGARKAFEQVLKLSPGLAEANRRLRDL